MSYITTNEVATETNLQSRLQYSTPAFEYAGKNKVWQWPHAERLALKTTWTLSIRNDSCTRDEEDRLRRRAVFEEWLITQGFDVRRFGADANAIMRSAGGS